jgi:hypothetical protein
MKYEEQWKVLADFLIELKKESEKIPTNVMNDLRSAKTMIQVLKSNPNKLEDISRVEKYLKSVESYTIITAEKHGIEKVELWLKKLMEEGRGKKEEKEITSRFFLGMPRNKKWIRIQVSQDMQPKDIKKLVDSTSLSYKIQKNGYILVSGNEEEIKSFIKRMMKRFRFSKSG